MLQQTLVLIKPDGVARAIIGEIIGRFERMGLKAVGMKMVWVDRDFSKKHYADHVEKPFYPGLEDFIVVGPVVALVLEGVDAIENVRKLVGATEPKSASPGTIRGDFAHVSYGYADAKNIGIKNLIHASDEPANAKKEIELWFKPEEIHSYKIVHDVHIVE